MWKYLWKSSVATVWWFLARGQGVPAGVPRYCGISLWDGSDRPEYHQILPNSITQAPLLVDKRALRFIWTFPLTFCPISLPLSSGLPGSASPSLRSSPFLGDWNKIRSVIFKTDSWLKQTKINCFLLQTIKTVTVVLSLFIICSKILVN